MTCNALFNVRLPFGFNRCRRRSPDDASIGAVPLQDAKWSRFGNLPLVRLLPAWCPRTTAKLADRGSTAVKHPEAADLRKPALQVADLLRPRHESNMRRTV